MMADKVGTCAWCERHNQQLFFMTYVFDGRFLSDWVCGYCLDEYRRDEMRKFRIAGEHSEPAE